MKTKRILLTTIAGIISAIALLPVFGGTPVSATETKSIVINRTDKTDKRHHIYFFHTFQNGYSYSINQPIEIVIPVSDINDSSIYHDEKKITVERTTDFNDNPVDTHNVTLFSFGNPIYCVVIPANTIWYIRFTELSDYAENNKITVGYVPWNVVDSNLVFDYDSMTATEQSFSGITSNVQHYGNIRITSSAGAFVSYFALTNASQNVQTAFKHCGLDNFYLSVFNRGKNARNVDDYSNGYADGQADSNVVMGFFPKIFGAVGSFFVDTLGGITLFGISLWQLVITGLGIVFVLLIMKVIT